MPHIFKECRSEIDYLNVCACRDLDPDVLCKLFSYSPLVFEDNVFWLEVREDYALRVEECYRFEDLPRKMLHVYRVEGEVAVRGEEGVEVAAVKFEDETWVPAIEEVVDNLRTPVKVTWVRSLDFLENFCFYSSRVLVLLYISNALHSN